MERKKTFLGEMASAEIVNRTETGKLLAAKLPELKGGTFSEFLQKCPLDLDFITANEMYKAINAAQ